MDWFRTLSFLEYTFIGLFLVFYVAYISRLIRISEVLQTSFKAVAGKIILRSTYFGLLMIALLGPSFGETTKEIQSVGKDIYIAVDLSQSMNAFDIQPTRKI